MGNDIKLPVSRRTQLLESQRALDAETRAQLKIDRLSGKLDSISNQIERVEHNIKEIMRSNDYYKEVITNMSKTLHHLDMELINEKLNDERFLEKAKVHLQELEEMNRNSETAPNVDYSPNIAILGDAVNVLNNDVAANEERIQIKFNEITKK